MEDFNGIFFYSFCFREALAIVEVDEVGGPVVLAPLSVFRTVPGEVSYFFALEAGVRGVSCGGCVALEVALWSISLIAVGVLLSAEVIASIISSIVSSCWSPISVYVHGDRGVVHPSWSVRRIVLWGILSLRAAVVPLGALLLGSKGSKVSVPSEYVSEQYF